MDFIITLGRRVLFEVIHYRALGAVVYPFL